MTKLYRVLVVPDLQVPYQDDEAMSCMERYARRQRWDEVLYLGDFMDFDQISRWTESTPGNWESSLADDYNIGNKILDRHMNFAKAKNRHCKFTFIYGNHDIRPELFTERMPQLKGLIEVESDNGLSLKSRGFRLVRAYPDGAVHIIGNAAFTHGLYTTQYHAAKHARVFGMPVYYGHTHDVQSHSIVTHGDNKTIEAHSMGCLAKHRMRYLKGAPTNWQHAFGVGYFLPNGFFNMYCVRIFNGKMIAPDGEIYEG